MRRLFYVAKKQHHRDERYSPTKLMTEARKGFDPPGSIARAGSTNHAATWAACAGVLNNQWDLAREFLALMRTRGMTEWGPLYWVLTVYCVQNMAEHGPADVKREALGFLAFLDRLHSRGAVPYPQRLELVLPDNEVVLHGGKRFHKVGNRFILTAGPRAVFNKAVGWQLANVASAMYHGVDTPETAAVKREELSFTKNDSNFRGCVAYRLPQNLTGADPTGFHLNTQVDWVRFGDDSVLLAAGDGDHSTKPPIRVVDAVGGVCRFFSPVPYKGDKHAKPSSGRIVVEGSEICAIAEGPGVAARSRARPLSAVKSWTRLTKKGEWQEIDPATQQPKDQVAPPPPVVPPVEPPPVVPPVEPPPVVVSPDWNPDPALNEAWGRRCAWFKRLADNHLRLGFTLDTADLNEDLEARRVFEAEIREIRKIR
ncbi:MAG: hypothetical protein OES32_09660 [Acidobacteriota bacterium]|nr:hypothetical protein [Acidobacteriota bacterium]MDH3523839.1 hypothetical protein [Acidobacteriota bacterium]